MMGKLTRRVTKHIPNWNHATAVEYNGLNHEIDYTVNTINKFWNLTNDGVVVDEGVPLDVLDHSHSYSIDVGAHVGCYTVLLELLNPSSTVIAFEPDESNRAHLAEICKLNDLTATIRAEVITESDETVSFYVDDTYSESHSTSPIEGFEEVEKSACSLSTVLEDKDSAYLKIDAEGGEDAIARDLAGVEDTTLSGIIELHPDKLQTRPNQVLGTLRKRFDRVEFISESSPSHPHEESIDHAYNRPLYYFE